MLVSILDKAEIAFDIVLRHIGIRDIVNLCKISDKIYHYITTSKVRRLQKGANRLIFIDLNFRTYGSNIVFKKIIKEKNGEHILKLLEFVILCDNTAKWDGDNGNLSGNSLENNFMYTCFTSRESIEFFLPYMYGNVLERDEKNIYKYSFSYRIYDVRHFYFRLKEHKTDVCLRMLSLMNLASLLHARRALLFLGSNSKNHDSNILVFKYLNNLLKKHPDYKKEKDKYDLLNIYSKAGNVSSLNE